jgi:dTDP-4-amino-4,6-dideoxygalactose transaminase
MDARRRADLANIEWRPFFPIPGDAGVSDSINVAREISQKGMCLPLSSAMADEEVDRVCEVIRGN